MTENSQKHTLALREKRGTPIYKSNPSVPDAELVAKRRPVRFGDNKRGFVVDGLGEVVGQGVAAFYEFEEVDSTRFVKFFLEGIKQIVGLSKAGLLVLEVVYRQMQDNHGSDEIKLSFDLMRIYKPDINDRTYRRGLKELLDREILFKSLIDGVFFVNIRYMFNGDRLTFVKGYKRKDSSLPNLANSLDVESDKK